MNIIITGASQGIGYAVVQYLLQQNASYQIIAISRNISPLQALQNKQLHPIAFDLTQPDFTSLVQQINHTCSNIDCLINNAGWLVNKSFTQLSDAELRHSFEINVLSPLRLIRDLYPHFNQQTKSHIVNIGSMGGFQGSSKFPGLSVYSASKGALAIATECLAEEWKAENIAINCLALGAVQTEMLNKAFPGYNAPLSAAQMAQFIADFALNGQQFFNGKIVPVSINTP